MQNPVRFRASLGRTIVAGLVLALAHPILAQDHRQQRVLALYVTTPGGAGATAFENVYRKVLGDALGSRLDFHSEFIDLARFSNPDYPPALVDFLHFKYQHLPPDLILATTEGARQFAAQSRRQLFPGTPMVFIDRVASPRPPPGTTGVIAALDLAGTLDLALTLQPDTTRVFVVSGVSEFDRFYETLAREQLQRLAGRVELTYLSGLPLAELERTVASLPPNSVIYHLTLGEDGAGARFRPTDALDRFAPLANVPIYTWHEVGMNHGVVGGRLYTNGVVAKRSAELALRILRGENPDDIPVVAVDPYVTQLDWRQLQRWGISEARVAQGTAILFREPSLWDQYKLYIVGTLALVFLQTALIAGLLFQRVRRRRVESALRESEQAMREKQASLQASHRQISDLFGRLIGAQETERTRIARDLHDDVSQRIAGLSIMISGVKRRLQGQPAAADVVATLTSLQENTVSLAGEIRHLSHDLHPGPLQHSGLAAALSVFCAQFETRHPVSVTYSAADDIGQIEADIALCLYRTAQEALRNVAKHADARHVSVALTRTTEGVQLSIADDGKGFDLAEARGPGSGLGLVSIDERVRLLRGSLHIETRPREGTRMEVRIPLVGLVTAV